MSAAARAFLIAAATAVSACASVALRNPPRIDVVGVSLERVDGPDAYFGVELALTNRAGEPVEIGDLQGALSIEGEKIADAKLVDSPVRIPAGGEAHAEMAAHAGMNAVLRAVASAIRRGAAIVAPGAGPALRYTLDATATLAGGARISFSRSGEIGARKP